MRGPGGRFVRGVLAGCDGQRRVTAIHLTNGEERSIGTRDAAILHGSDDYVYA